MHWLPLVKTALSKKSGKTNANNDATDAYIAQKYNAQEPGETNMNKIYNNQHVNKTANIIHLPESKNVSSLLTSKGHSKSLECVTPDKGRPMKNLVTLTHSAL